jgi:acyl-CoA synthetase (AMP-forming)/AMP-acid ligase II
MRSSSLGGRREELRGRSILIAAKEQLPAALALIELDGIARRMILWPPDFSPDHLAFVMKAAGVDAVVSDGVALAGVAASIECMVACSPLLSRADSRPDRNHQTEWVLLTSGTTGAPKIVLHTLASLARAITVAPQPGTPIVWSTFYDIRRYGGLQIFLRAIIGGGSMVLSGYQEPAGDFLARAAAYGVTHISGTPSHWRLVLMSSSAGKLAPQYVRLSGEIADQAILDSLRAFYPEARLVHAFASTEGGLAFEVADGRAGFPARLISERSGEVELKVEDGSLRIRSARIASRYLGSAEAIADSEGFVDTRDIVELHGGRYYFAGRRDGVINVGGQKVYPEEIENVINRHPQVQMSLVKARRNPITGAVVIADVVMKSAPDGCGASNKIETIKLQIFEACRSALAPYKVPATIHFVSSVEVAASGKLARSST